MKELAGLTSLIKLILYDILGFLAPGIFCFSLCLFVIGDWLNPNSPFDLINKLLGSDRIYLYLALFISYSLGYLLQSIAIRITELFTELGYVLINRVPADKEKEHVLDGASAVTAFVERLYSHKYVYSEAKRIIAKECQIADPSELSFSDVSRLALGIAGDEADLADQFRFRADFCSAMATLSLITAILLPLLLIYKNGLNWLWIFAPLAFCISAFIYHKYPKMVTVSFKRIAVPVAILLLLTVLNTCTNQGISLSLVLFTFLVIWFFLLWRCYFYMYLGGSVIFTIATVVIAKQKNAATDKKASV